MVTLLGAGEFDVLFTGLDREVRRLADRGVPVAWTFPEGPYFGPLPGSMMIVRGTPRVNAAKLFLTYWSSKEGQPKYAHTSRAEKKTGIFGLSRGTTKSKDCYPPEGKALKCTKGYPEILEKSLAGWIDTTGCDRHYAQGL